MADYEIYCDECRQDLISNKKIISQNNMYTILGGIWIDNEIREKVKNDIKNLKKKYNVYGEIKWKTVCNKKIDFYIELINLFFKYNTNEISFRAIVVNAEVFNIKKYHNNNAELGFYKLYYQLLKNWILEENKYNIFLDYRTDKSKYRAYDLKRIINQEKSQEIIKNIQFINSKESLLLQLEDLIMGAVGYKFNFKNNGKSIPKNKIVDQIEKYTEINCTTKTRTKFNIFKIKLGGENLL